MPYETKSESCMNYFGKSEGKGRAKEVREERRYSALLGSVILNIASYVLLLFGWGAKGAWPRGIMVEFSDAERRLRAIIA